MKEQAEFYKVGLRLGIITVAEVIAWCDSVIMANESPDIAIIEASISGSQGADAVADALSEVEGEFNSREVRKRIFGAMYDSISRDRKQAPQVARQLFHMAIDSGVANEEAESELWYFDDAFGLATEGIYGDAEKITDELLLFLKAHSKPE